MEQPRTKPTYLFNALTEEVPGLLSIDHWIGAATTPAFRGAAWFLNRLGLMSPLGKKTDTRKGSKYTELS